MLGDLIGDLGEFAQADRDQGLFQRPGILQADCAGHPAQIDEIPHVADVEDGLIVAGPSLTFRVRLGRRAALRADRGGHRGGGRRRPNSGKVASIRAASGPGHETSASCMERTAINRVDTLRNVPHQDREGPDHAPQPGR